MTERAEMKVFDIAIIGAGPAGMTAALYGARNGLDVALFERLAPGGGMAQTEHLENYPGYTQSKSGFELALAMHEQAVTFGANAISEEVVSLDVSGEVKVVGTPFGEYGARSVIVASGTRPWHLGLEHEDELLGRGMSYCATCDGGFFRGQDVVVVGGGNTAVMDAIYLSKICRSVHLVHRRDTLRATQLYAARVEQLENVTIHWNTEVTELLFDAMGITGVRIASNQTDEMSEIACSGVFVAVGTTPNTEFLRGVLELDEKGYVVACEDGETKTPGVFAAGDVRSKSLRQVVTAVSDGANCAESAFRYLQGI